LQSRESGRKGLVIKGSLLLDRGVIHLGADTVLGGYTLIGSPVGPTLIDFCGIREVLRDRSGKATSAMLRAIIQVAQERNLLGRVKGYVISRLYQIARSEPRKYGLQFSPELVTFVGGVDALNISTGQPDTLFQSENAEDLDSRVDSLCTEFLKVNHLKAFETRKRLVDQLLVDGVVFVGFVDSGRLQLNGEPPAGELFAYDIGTGDVVAGRRLAQAANLSPVFRLKTRKRDHLLRLRREVAGFESASLPEFFSNQ